MDGRLVSGLRQRFYIQGRADPVEITVQDANLSRPQVPEAVERIRAVLNGAPGSTFMSVTADDQRAVVFVNTAIQYVEIERY